MGIRALLEQADDAQILAETDVLGACAYAQLHPLDALVLDASFSMETARVAASILAKNGTTAIIFVGSSPASVWMAGRVNSGRALILDHGVSHDGMVAAINASVDQLATPQTGNGDHPSLNSHGQPADNGRREDQRETLLSAREWEVLSLLAKGCTDKDIARELVISQHTAKGHVRNVLRKLEVPNRAAAAAFVALLAPAASGLSPR
jgi:DNA-binding NarL/FixJ family response regulator